MDTLTIRDFYRQAQAGKLQLGEYRLEKYGRAVYAVTVAEAPGAVPLNAPGPAAVEVKPVVEPEPIPEPEPVEPVVEPAPEVVPAAPAVGNASRLAALLARGRSALSKAATADLPDDPAPSAPAMSQSRWRKLDPDAQARHVRANVPTVTDEDSLADWLESLPR
jgi:hypothetical protein